MSDVVNVSRRDFLRTGLLVGGGLVLGLHLPSLATGEPPASAGGVRPFALNAFVRVGSDDSVSVVVNHSEMGQGIYTSMPMVVAEELDADWAKVRFEAAPVAAVYNHPIYGAQLTGGSSSTWVVSSTSSTRSRRSAPRPSIPPTSSPSPRSTRACFSKWASSLLAAKIDATTELTTLDELSVLDGLVSRPCSLAHRL